KSVDQHTRTLLKGAIEGVLSLPAQQPREAAAMTELTALFRQPDAVRELAPAGSTTFADKGLPAAFAQGCQTVEALEDIADFLFAGVAVRRQDGMTLPQLLRLGMTLRHEAGIDGLERILLHAPANASQQALRDHALQALRRAQQRLLARVLQSPPT